MTIYNSSTAAEVCFGVLFGRRCVNLHCACFIFSTGPSQLRRAPLWFPAVSAVLAASVSTVALSVPQNRCQAQFLRHEHAMGSGCQLTAESDE